MTLNKETNQQDLEISELNIELKDEDYSKHYMKMFTVTALIIKQDIRCLTFVILQEPIISIWLGC